MKAKDLLNDPALWTQGAFAARQDGVVCSPQDPYATCWCVLGAVQKCYPDSEDEAIARQKIITALGGLNYPGGLDGGIADFNDNPSTTYSDICNVLELADV